MGGIIGRRADAPHNQPETELLLAFADNAKCASTCLRFLPCTLRPLVQVYVGDFIKIGMEENTKGWSIAQVEELYQTPSVSCKPFYMLLKHPFQGCPGPGALALQAFPGF